MLNLLVVSQLSNIHFLDREQLKLYFLLFVLVFFWQTDTLVKCTGYDDSTLQVCANLIALAHQRAGQGSLTAVYKKYCHPKYSEVARVTPLLGSLPLRT